MIRPFAALVACAAATTSVIAPEHAGAQTHAVIATASVSVDGTGDAGISYDYPFVLESTFHAGAHSLPTTALGADATAFGAVSSALHRLPYFHELRIGAATMQAGQLSTGGAVSGLALDLASFDLSGGEATVLTVSPDEAQLLTFGPIELGGGATPQAGELQTELAPLANATLVSGAWSVTSNSLTSWGTGTVVLESPISLSSDQQSGETIPGQATMTLSFVPEPSATWGLASGAAGLCLLNARRRRRH